jgi:peptidoglycan/xylan/chitin deacetylase (PgdA/CDA1 family)
MRVLRATTLATLLAQSAVVTAVASDSAVVLMYHRFGEDRYPSTNIRIEQLEAQLEHLRDGGYTVIPMADLVAALTDGRPLPDRAVVVTVDDAYRSVYEVAFPRFRRNRLPFTVFVATDPVDDRLPDYMTWDQMREMAAAGVTFANHGASHSSLVERRTGESDADWRARVRSDLEKGRRRLSEELDPLETVFAYPYGEYDTVTASIVRDMGYLAFGQQSGAVGPSSDRRALPRFPMAEAFADPAEFRTKIASLPLPVSSVEPWDPVVATPRPTLEVTLDAGDAQLDRLACFVSGQGQVEVEWLEPDRRFRVGPAADLGAGRQRVNCTAPRPDGRFVWFSHPWIVRPDATNLRSPDGTPNATGESR